MGVPPSQDKPCARDATAPTGEAESPATDAQWEVIAPLFDHLRLRRHHARELLDALFYVNKTGCQWRELPADYPPWPTAYYHYERWRRTGLLHAVHDGLRRLVRQRAGRAPTPSALIIDSQSVKTSAQGGEARGFDGGKLVRGRKRHVVVDTLGLVWGVLVDSAGVAESQRAPHVP